MATKFTAECDNKLPRWLAGLNENSNSFSLPTRPCTNNINIPKPSWFNDLIQNRRHSDELPSLFSTIRVQKYENTFQLKSPTPSMKQQRGKSNDYLQIRVGDLREESAQQEQTEQSEYSFEIPCLPKGKILTLKILTNWGDENFVGLNGIEVFDAKTFLPAAIEKITVNGLPSNDTSVLIDNVYRSHDEKHIWQRQLDEKITFPLTLQIHFVSTIQLALFRIWNHNKSRIYWDRGIRDIELFLDQELIFRGEITRAHGSLTGPAQNLGDTILFTTDEQILEKVAQNDTFFGLPSSRRM